MIIPSQKHLFDIPDSHAYLNTAYMSALMHSVAEAMIDGTELKKHPWKYSSQDFFTYSEQARKLAARIFNSKPDCVAIVASASYGLQIAANAVPLDAGQNVVVMEDQFPSNIYTWQDKARRVDAELRIVSTPQNHDWTQALLKALDKNTRVLAISQTHWASGATLDLPLLRRALDKIGAALVLDLTQSLGAQPFDVQNVRPDFAVAATYKWMMGPYTLGFLYIDPKWYGAEPLEHNWLNREGSEDFTRLTQYRDAFQTGAKKFDMGARSNPGQLMGASAAMTQILEWGVENISRTLGAKTSYIATRLVARGLSVLPEHLRAPHYLGVIFNDGVPPELTKNLAAQNIFVSVRGRAMRVTPHLYSSDTDIERFISAIMSAEL